MIIDNYIAEQFIDPTTAPWTPLTGITATITIWSVVNWVKTKVIDDASCTNDGEGYYSYLFTDMQPSTFYMYEIVPSATAYRVSGWIDYRMEKIDANISDMRVWWGWGGNYSQAIQTAISNAKKSIEKKIEEEHNKTRQIVIDWDSETNSHIELAKDKTIGKIESIEIPETDLSDINKSLGVVKANLTKAISGKDKEKEELAKDYEKKLKEKAKEIEELEETYNELEGTTEEQINEKVSEKEELIQELEETAKELMEEYEEENKNAKDLVIEKIKQSI